MTGYTKKWYEAYMKNRHVERRSLDEGLVRGKQRKCIRHPKIDANKGKHDFDHQPQIQYLWIPGRLPGMNEIILIARTHWAKSAAQKQDYTSLVASYCKRLKPMKRVWLSIHYHEANKKRDPDNIAAGKKFLLDGLVQGGVLANDGHAQVAGFDERFFFDDREGVEIFLSECL